jgi:hypothetical protein
MYSLIGMLEVILRNSIDRHMIAQKGPNWLEDAIAPGGFLQKAPGCEGSVNAIQNAMYKLGLRYTHDNVIPELSFGFWRYQFAPKDFAASGSSLLDIFVNRPYGITQKDILQRLTQINALRNRIAHHEPICFEGNLISTAKVERRYKTILELLEWLGCNRNKILYGINGVRKSIDLINSI